MATEVPYVVAPPAFAEQIATRLKWILEGLDGYAKAQGLSLETRHGQTDEQANEEMDAHYPLWTAKLNLTMEINAMLRYSGIDPKEFWARPTLAQQVAQAQQPPTSP